MLCPACGGTKARRAIGQIFASILTVMRPPHVCHAMSPIEARNRTDLYGQGRWRALLSLLACPASLLREVFLFQTLALLSPRAGPYCFPVSSKCSSKTFGFGSIRLTLPCIRRMADMSAPALLESLSIDIFNLSLRRRTASSSRGPAFPRHEFEPNPPPSARLNGKRRFLLPRPFAPLSMGSILGWSPFFSIRPPRTAVGTPLAPPGRGWRAWRAKRA